MSFDVCWFMLVINGEKWLLPPVNRGWSQHCSSMIIHYFVQAPALPINQWLLPNDKPRVFGLFGKGSCLTVADVALKTGSNDQPEIAEALGTSGSAGELLQVSVLSISSDWSQKGSTCEVISKIGSVPKPQKSPKTLGKCWCPFSVLTSRPCLVTTPRMSSYQLVSGSLAAAPRIPNEPRSPNRYAASGSPDTTLVAKLAPGGKIMEK